MNQWLDSYQIFMDILFGHKKELIRIFKVTAVEKLKIHGAGTSVFLESMLLVIKLKVYKEPFTANILYTNRRYTGSSYLVTDAIWLCFSAKPNYYTIFIAPACSRVRYRRPIFRPSVRPSVRQSVRPSIRPSVRPSVCQHLCRRSTFMSKLVF